MSKKIAISAICCIAAVTLCAAGGIKWSTAKHAKQNSVWSNQYFRFINTAGKNHLMGLWDSRDNKPLMIRSWLWYAGKSRKPGEKYASYSEEGASSMPYIGCNAKLEKNADGSDKLVVDTTYQTPDFDILRKVTLFDNKPYFLLSYTLTAREDDNAPGSFSSPLLLFDKNWDTVIYNTSDGFSEPKAYKKGFVNSGNASSNTYILINKKLNRSLVLMANLNSGLECGFQGAPRVKLSSTWAQNVGLGHGYVKPNSLKKGDKVKGEWAIAVVDSVTLDDKVKGIINEMMVRFNWQPRLSELRPQALEDEQKKPSVFARQLPAQGNVSLWSESAGKKVYPITAIPQEKADGVVIKAAKREGESFQIVLAPKSEIELTGIAISPAKNSAGAEIATVEARFNEYQQVAKSLALSGLSDKVADKMLTPAMALPRKLAAGENQPLMFTVDVPAGIAAGDYKGVVTITWRENGAEKSANIPYTVKVWNFELPKHLSYRAFGVNWSACGMPAAKLLARYHYNIGTPNLTASGVEMRRPSQGFHDNFTKMNLPNFFDAARELTNEYNCNVVTIPFTFCGNCMWTTKSNMYGYNLKYDDPEYARQLHFVVKSVADQLRADGLLDKAILYNWDEVGPAHVAGMKKTMEIIRKAAPDAKILNVGPVSKELIDLSDIIVGCDYYNWWSKETEKLIWESKAKGKEFWIYLNGTAFVTGNSAAITRLVPWQGWPRGISGYLQWATLANAESTFASHGHVWLVYPYDYTKGEEPVPAARMVYFRDGIEDYEYFEMARKLPNFKEIEAKILKIVPKNSGMVNDLETMLNIRDEIGEALSAAGK